MVERKKLGLIYNYNENWIGGTYYIHNLIMSLNKLDESKKPKLFILTENKKDYYKLKTITSYKHISWVNIKTSNNIIVRILNKTSQYLCNKKIIKKAISKSKFDYVYPCYTTSIPYLENISEENKIYWIPDFQEIHLPSFFKVKDIDERMSNYININNCAKKIVFSSLDAKSDFNNLFPKSKVEKIVLNFKVSLPDISDINLELTKDKYNIPKNYLFVSNQFWVHKNHITVLKALTELVKSDNRYHIVFSGKTYEHRVKNYFESILEFVKKEDLILNTTFLGFIDRKEQLKIMSNAIAIIQPSLFEGWSTVLEDAKSLGLKIIASNLNVHKEQLMNYSNKIFFEKNSVSDLVSKINSLDDLCSVKFYSYDEEIKNFAHEFINILK